MSIAPPNSAPTNPTSGLARALLQANKLTNAQLDSIQKKAQIDKSLFIDALLQNGAMNTKDLAVFCSETFGYPLLDLSTFNIDMLPEKLIDFKLMHAQRVIALSKKGNKASLAISDPTNVVAIDQIKFQTGLSLDIVIVQHDILIKLIYQLIDNYTLSAFNFCYICSSLNSRYSINYSFYLYIQCFYVKCFFL